MPLADRGFFISLQYMTINTLVHADMSEEQKNNASSIASSMEPMTAKVVGSHTKVVADTLPWNQERFTSIPGRPLLRADSSLLFRVADAIGNGDLDVPAADRHLRQFGIYCGTMVRSPRDESPYGQSKEHGL